jgi:hypothetical protein
MKDELVAAIVAYFERMRQGVEFIGCQAIE